MQTPPETAYRNFDAGSHVRDRVGQEIARLEQFFPRIISCRVVVERINRRHRSGDLYGARIFISLPDGKDVAVNREPGDAHAHEDVLVAIRDAFDAAQRQLEDFARIERGDVKTHQGRS